MKIRYKLFQLLVIFLLLSPALLRGQQVNVNLDYNPQKNTEGLNPFSAPENSPEVHDDHTVTFRLKAPNAQKVVLPNGAIYTSNNLGKELLTFTKGEDGIWTLTIGPLKPDMYAYHFNVDGVQIPDPSNTYAAFTAMPPYSELIVHGDGPAYYDARNVPHGAVTRHIYHSDVTNGEREFYVYTPPGYNSKKEYPVLYLLGGSGELPSNFKFYSNYKIGINSIQVDPNNSKALIISLSTGVTSGDNISVSYFPGNLVATDGSKVVAFGPEGIRNPLPVFNGTILSNG